MIVAPDKPQLRWKRKDRNSLPSAPGVVFKPVAGYYIWLGDAEQPSRSWDPVYAQRLAFLNHHPGFRHDVEALRDANPPDESIASIAGKWQLTERDLRAYIEDDDALDALGDTIFVELRPAEYVVHIPRPLTRARIDAVKQWLTEARRLPWIHEWSGGDALHRQKDAHLSPQLVAHLDWYDRWQEGEGPRDIANSLDPLIAEKWPEENIRTTLQRIHRELRAISPEGLKSPGP